MGSPVGVIPANISDVYTAWAIFTLIKYLDGKRVHFQGNPGAW